MTNAMSKAALNMATKTLANALPESKMAGFAKDYSRYKKGCENNLPSCRSIPDGMSVARHPNQIWPERETDFSQPVF